MPAESAAFRVQQMVVLRKSVALCLAGAVLALPVGSLFVQQRVAGGSYVVFALTLFGLGALITIVNLSLSFLRYPSLALFGRSVGEVRSVSGVPILGVLVLPGLMLAPVSTFLSISGFLLLLLDTGGIPWFVFAVWSDSSFWRGQS